MRYVRPNDLEEAVAAVAGGGLPLAGGSVLVPLLARAEVEPAAVVDVGRLPALRELRDAGDELIVGAAVTLERLARVEPAGEAALTEAAASVGNPLVRRVATVGGNVASRLAQAALVPALLALDATVVWADDDEATPIADVLGGAPQPGRLVASVRIGRDASRRSGFFKLAWREATGAAVASVAVAALDRDGEIVEPRVAAGGLMQPARLGRAESVLAGRAWSEPPVDAASSAAADDARELARLDDPGDPRPELVALGVRRLLGRLGQP